MMNIKANTLAQRVSIVLTATIVVILSAGVLIAGDIETANAAAKKTVYVPSKQAITNYNEDTTSKTTYKYSYTSQGVLKSLKVVMGDITAISNAYKHNSAGRVTSSTAESALSTKAIKFKYIYDKNGRVSKVKSGSKMAAAYKYNKNGTVKAMIEYNNGKKNTVTKYSYKSKKLAIAKEYDKSGKLTSTKTYKVTTKSGRVVKVVEYDASTNEKTMAVKVSYKKFKLTSKQANIVKKQTQSFQNATSGL